MCGVIVGAVEHMNGVTRNYLAQDGSAPFSFVIQVAEEASETIGTVGEIYLEGEYDQDLRSAVRLWNVAVTNLDRVTNQGAGVAELVKANVALEAECEGT